MMILQTENIVGSPAKNVWSQAQSIVREDGSKILVIVKLACEDENTIIDLAEIGIEIVTNLEANGIAGAEKIAAETEKNSLKLDLLLGELKEAKLSVYGRGEVKAYLARNGKLASLGKSATGVVQKNDILLFCTGRFEEIIGLGKLQETLTRNDSPAEILTPLVHVENETSGVAAIVGEMKSDEQKMSWPVIKLRSSESPRRTNLLIGAVILILLVIMIGFGVVKRNRGLQDKQFNTVFESVNTKIAEATSIGDLNPERAKNLLSEAKYEVERYLDNDLKDEYLGKGRSLQQSIVEAEDRAFKKNEIKLNTFVELGIVLDGLTSQSMKSNGKDNLVFFDEDENRIVAVNLSDRSRVVIEPENDQKIIDLSFGEKKVYSLDSEGVYQLDWKKNDSKRVIEKDEFWKEPKLIETFAENIYVFDREQSEIWKYPTLGETFGGRRRWLAAGITPDLSKVVDMKVAGDIWLLTETGKLERYSRGAPVTFPMEGFPAKGESKRLSDPKSMWVTESLIYVLEAGASRVVVFGDDGKYQSQYVNSEFEKASDLVVVDDKAYVLINNVVHEFGL